MCVCAQTHNRRLKMKTQALSPSHTHIYTHTHFSEWPKEVRGLAKEQFFGNWPVILARESKNFNFGRDSESIVANFHV